MKIIGKTRDGFILESSAEELANLCGHYSHYPSVDGYKTPSVGDDVQVSAMYHKLYELARDRDKIRQAKDALIDAAARLEPVAPIIASVLNDARPTDCGQGDGKPPEKGKEG